MLEVQFYQEKTGKTRVQRAMKQNIFFVFFDYTLRNAGIYSNVSATTRGKIIK